MKVLVLRLSSLGDVVLLAGVLKAVKAANPQIHLSCLVKPAYAGAVDACVDEVLIYKDFWQALALIRRERWDEVLDLHGVFKARLLSWLVPANNKITYRKEGLRRRLLVLCARLRLPWRPQGFTSVRDRYWEAAMRAGLVGAFTLPVVTPAKAGVQAWIPASAGMTEKILKIQEWDDKPDGEICVGMAPGAKWATKRWPSERFARLARRLRENHPKIRISLIGDSGDRALCEEIRERAGTEGVENLAGQLDLSQLSALTAKFSLFVSNDSGPMHIADALGVPLVALFGPTVREFGFYPLSVSSAVAEEDLACRPCSLHGGDECPAGHFLCLRLISVEKIMRLCEEVLQKKRTPVPC